MIRGGLAWLVLLLAASPLRSRAGDLPVRMPLSDAFRRLQAPETGRQAVQLTSGEAFCYPLYFYIPSITRDAKYLVYHRAEAGEVQLYRLNLRTGRSVPLTHARHRDTRWRPWGVDSGRGVLDHRSVLNVARGLAIYFDGNRVRSVNVQTLDDELLLVIPADREPTAQNCTTPDGKWFVYIHAPRGSEYGKPCKAAAVAAYNFDTKENRVLTRIDAAIDHVTAYDDAHFIFAHPHQSTGMMMTDLVGGKYVLLRQGDPGARGKMIHCQITQRGLAYEVPGVMLSGLYDPLGRRRFEFKLPPYFKHVHTGCDPQGRLWFYENADGEKLHDMYALVQVDKQEGTKWLRLTGNWPTYGGGQKAHFHPRLTPDRRWILFTAGDARTKTNHVFLLDVSDLKDTQGISTGLLSPSGANDIVR